MRWELVRAGPPFPYLRWTGPPPLARSSAAARSAGSGDATSTASPRDRMREREPGRVQELALQPVAAGAAVLRVAGDRVADRQQVRADLVRAAGLEPHAQQRVVAAAPRSTSKWVTASRGSSVSVETRVRTRRSRPSGASIVPRRAGGRPSTSARYSRTSSRAGELRLQRGVGRVVARHHEQARTCRGRAGARSPARSGSSPPAARPASACASVPVRWPRAGCTTTPAGLSTTSRCSSSQATANRAGARRRRGAAGSASATATRSPPASTWRLRAARRRPSRARRRSAAAPRRASRRARRGRRRGARPRPPAGTVSSAAIAAPPSRRRPRARRPARPPRT